MWQFFIYAVVGAFAIAGSSCLSATADHYRDCSIAVALLCFSLIIAIPQAVTVHLHPRTYDLTLYRIDLALGLDPLILARWVSHARWREAALEVVYNSLPLALAIAYLAERSMLAVKASAIGAAGAFVVYNLVPAVGPIHAMAGFPDTATGLAPALAYAPRNCMPSMHFAWALFMIWNARSSGLRIFAWSFAALTALATIGLGEHYYIDLIAAIPFCWLVQTTVKEKLKWQSSFKGWLISARQFLSCS